jgi:hypothetical protein
MTHDHVKNVMKATGAASFVLYPLMLIVAFAMHYTSVGEFFEISLRYEQLPIAYTVATFMGSDANRMYVWPHFIGYFSVPVMVAASLTLAYVLFERAPWFALIGSALTVTGGLFLSGVFAAWLSFAALGNLPADQTAAAVAALTVLTEMQGALAVSTYLSVLVFLGLMVSAVGLYRARIVPTWSPATLFLGNVMIMAFMDIDNLMLVGAVLMLAGLAPVGRWLLFGSDRAETPGIPAPQPG